MSRKVLLASGFALGFSSGLVVPKLKDVLLSEKPPLPTEEEIMAERLKKTGEQILRFGAPQNSPDLSYHRNFVLKYDQERRIPKWVAERLTKEHLKGDAHRSKSKFKSDPAVPQEFTADNSDYINSGWSRGHMAPAGDNKYDQLSMNETFYLSNVLPQNLDNNAGYWNRLEMYCRDLTDTFTNVYVMSGPVMMPRLQANGEKKFITYNLIGRNEVSVPTHMFKVVIAEKAGSNPAMAAFIIPNLPVPNDQPLAHFQVPIEQVEKRIGLHVYPKLNRTETDNLCKVDGCKLRDWNEFELYMLDRKLRSAKTLNRLEKVWEEGKRKNVRVDDKVMERYETKRLELEEKQKLTKDGVE